MNIVFNKANTFHNYDSFVMGDVRVLFITGFSGSGKTTMAKDLEEILSVKRVSLDQYLRPLIREKMGNVHPDYVKVYLEQGIKMLLEEHPTGQLIVEGCQIAWFDAEEIKRDHALICVGTSMLVSCYRAMRRSLSMKNLKKYGLFGIHKPLQFNLMNFKLVQNFNKHFA